MKKTTIIKNFLPIAFLSLFMLEPAFAATDISGGGSDKAAIIAALNKFVAFLGYFFAVLLMINGGMKLQQYANRSQNGVSIKIIVFQFVAGAMLLNYATSISTLAVSVLGSGNEYCFILDSFNSKGQCWDAASSELTGTIQAKIEAISGSSTSAQFIENLNLIVGFFQLIGFIYFIKACMVLAAVGNGRERGGYGKPVIMLLFSALVINLPNTIQYLVNTLKAFGMDI